MVEPHAAAQRASQRPRRARCSSAAVARSAGWRRCSAERPFASARALYQLAERHFSQLAEQDYLEAFSHHPRIGEDLAALRARFASTAQLASEEQAGARAASEATLLSLREANRAYFERFGFIFIICATGKSAEQMLEAAAAAARQHACSRAGVSHRRAGQDHAPASGEADLMSRISTHILDTASGRPADGVSVRLDVLTDDGSFLTLAEHSTDRDGRIADFLPRGAVEARTYRLTFDTGGYFSSAGSARFLSVGGGGVSDQRHRAAPPCAAAAEPLRLLHLPRQLSSPGVG